MLEVIGQLFTLSMIILGSILLYQRFIVGHRMPKVATRVHGSVQLAARRPVTQRRRLRYSTVGVIAWYVAAIAAYAVALKREIGRANQEAWQLIMSRTSPPATPTRMTHAGETETKRSEMAETGEMADQIAITPLDAESRAAIAEAAQIALLAKLVRARLVTQTAGLECAFNVTAGGSPAYKDKRDKLQRAIERQAPPADVTQPAPPAQSEESATRVNAA